jgi:hypothetical protein
VSRTVKRKSPTIAWVVAAVWVFAGLVWTVARGADVSPLFDSLPRSGYAAPWLLATGVLFLGILLFRTRRFAPAVGLVVVLVVAVVSTHHMWREGKQAEIFGRGVSWLDDDVMISMRYAKNLADGEGLVWNEGERVEGYTNFLWTVMLTPVHRIASTERVSAWVSAGTTTIFLMLIVTTSLLTRRVEGGTVAALLASLALATSSSALNWTVAGGEAVLLALWLTLLARETTGEGTGRSRALRAGLLGGAAYLTRPDAAVAVGVLILVIAWRERRSRSFVVWLVAAAAVLPLLHTVFRLSYYGDWLPNTYYLKATGWQGRQTAGLGYVIDLVRSYAVWGVAAGMAAVAVRKTRPLVAAVAAQIVYVAWIGGDELPEQRFFLPVLPLLVIATFVGAEWLARRMTDKVGVVAHALPVTILAVAGLAGGILPGAFPDSHRRRSGAEMANVAVGYLLRENTTPEARVAHFWAGAAPYFSNRPSIDLYGKSDPTLARLPAREAIAAAGHNKYDFDHSLALEPDVIVGGLGGLAAGRPEVVAANKRSDYRAFGELLDHPVFRERYADNLVGAGPGSPDDLAMLSLRWHGLFVRDGTPNALPVSEWQEPGSDDH